MWHTARAASKCSSYIQVKFNKRARNFPRFFIVVREKQNKTIKNPRHHLQVSEISRIFAENLNFKKMMSEQELNNYRLTSMEEPTDEMLAQIMREAAEIYNRENEEAHEQMICKLRKMSEEYSKEYSQQYGII